MLYLSSDRLSILLLILLPLQVACAISYSRPPQPPAATIQKEPPYVRQATFDPNDYFPYTEAGTASITGEAFLRTRGGDVRYAAGETIMLIPATPYAREFLEQDVIRNKENIEPRLDKRIYDTIRSTTADSRGRFAFSKVPAGQYILYTSIYWSVPGRFYSLTGGPIIKDVAVSHNEQTTVILTR